MEGTQSCSVLVTRGYIPFNAEIYVIVSPSTTRIKNSQFADLLDLREPLVPRNELDFERDRLVFLYDIFNCH